MKTINYALKYVPVTDGNEGCEGIAFVTALHPNMAVTEQGKEAIKKALFETLKLQCANGLITTVSKTETDQISQENAKRWRIKYGTEEI